MAYIEVKDLTFAYPKRGSVLSGANLTAEKGDFIVLFGANGCGKTTLLRHFKPEAAPEGQRSGSICIADCDIFSLSLKTSASMIGFVMQDPDSQIVTDKVWHELAFGLESLGRDNDTIRRKVAETASFFGIESWYHKKTSELSGGQKQLLNLASVMVSSPEILVLDEPTSRLDPIAAGEFLSAVVKLNRELGVTVIMAEHELGNVFPVCTKSAVMRSGHIIYEGSPENAGNFIRQNCPELALSLPAPMRIWASVLSRGTCPLSVSDGKRWLLNYADENSLHPLPEKTYAPENSLALSATGIHFKYDKTENDILREFSLKAYFGSTLAVLGGNGSGKTTAVGILAGILRPYRGKVTLNGSVGYLPQDPKMLFLHESVLEELRDVSSDNIKIRETAKLCSIEDLLPSHPYDLSGGEMQKAALAKVLLADPDILLLDEPTKGLDSNFKLRFGEILSKLKSLGKAIIIVSHDTDFCAEYADCAAFLFDGEIISLAPPDCFFSENSFFTTKASLMSRSLEKNAVTTGDIIYMLTGHIAKPPAYPQNDAEKPSAPVRSGITVKKHVSSVDILSLIVFFLIVPATIFFGQNFLGARKYAAISVVVMLEFFVPLFTRFEKSRPKARQLVLLSSMCAIAVAGRWAFGMVPEFKPLLAVVIISGAALGAQAGAMVGAVSMFISNMLFSQGIWTPWQMLAAGIIGFLSGILFYGRAKRLFPVCFYGAAATLVVYGGIMNPAAVIMFQSKITLPLFFSSIIAGLPLDLIHTAATVTFLLLLAKPMFQKLDRIIIKYGITL